MSNLGNLPIMKSAKKNYVYNLIYQLLLIILPLITTPYISRVLGAGGVGQSSFVASLISYFVILANLGYGYYAQRVMAKMREDKYEKSKAFYEILMSRAIFVVLSILINLVLVFLGVYGDNNLLMLISTISIVAVLFDISFFFQGNEDFSVLVIKNLIIKILGIIAIFLFVKNSDDTWVYVLITVASGLLGNVFMWVSLKGNLEKVKVKELSPFKHVLPSLKLFIPTIAVSIYTVLDKSLIGIITGSNIQNGWYEQADKIVKMAMTIVTSLSTVMIPRNSYEIEKGNYDVVRENCYKATHFVWLAGVPIMGGICLIASNLIPWFMGAGYEGVAPIMYILSALIIIISLSGVIGLQYIIPMGKDSLFTWCISAGAVINLILNIPFIYLWGAIGASIATIVAETAITTIMLITTRKELETKKIFKTAWKPLVAGLIMCAVTTPLAILLESGILNTLIIVATGIVSYGISILCLKDSIVVGAVSTIKSKLFKK